MDDHWEDDIREFGAINITGFRIVDHNRRYVRDFMEGWSKVSPLKQGRENTTKTISVRLIVDLIYVLCPL